MTRQRVRFPLIRAMVLLWLSFSGINKKLRRINRKLARLEARIANIPDFDYDHGVDEYDERSYNDPYHTNHHHSARFGNSVEESE